MSDAREEAAIAREALVRDKKKPKQKTTLIRCFEVAFLNTGRPPVGPKSASACHTEGSGDGGPPN